MNPANYKALFGVYFLDYLCPTQSHAFLWYSVSTDRRGEKEMQWRKERTVKDRFLEREKLNKIIFLWYLYVYHTLSF